MIKRTLTTCLTLAIALSTNAQSNEGERILAQMVPQCYDATLTRGGYPGKLPNGYTAEQVSMESPDPHCRFDATLVKTTDGRWYVGRPWPIGGTKGTPAEKLKKFAWEKMGESFLAESAGQDGNLEKLSVRHVTEAGRVNLEGYVDPAGTVFMLGDIAASGNELATKRDQRLAPIVAKAPSKGPADASIQIVEFSDFQCPSCKQAHAYMTDMLKKYDGKVRYTRIDMPLVGNHPWAFAASLIGRAIHRQKPDAFWAWKDAVYANQADLNPFTIDQFGRNFAEDHGIDMAKYDADVVSEGVQQEILAGVGEGFTIGVAGTPTFIVNGRFVAAGNQGKNLDRYLEELTAK